MPHSDTFTLHGSEVAGEDLGAHVSAETGMTWTRISDATNTAIVTAGNHAAGAGSGGSWSMYTYNQVQSSADEVCECDILFNGPSSMGAGLLTRVDGSGNGYALIWAVYTTAPDHLALTLFTVVAGTLTTQVGGAWQDDTTVIPTGVLRLRLEPVGTTINAYVSSDGGTTWTLHATWTDSTYAAAGKTGLILLSTPFAPGSDTSRMVAGNFDLGAYSPPINVDVYPDDANLIWSDNWLVSHAGARTTNDGAANRFSFTGSDFVRVIFDPTALAAGAVPTGRYPKYGFTLDEVGFTTGQIPDTGAAVSLAAGLSTGAIHLLDFRMLAFDPRYDRWLTPANLAQIVKFQLNSGGYTVPTTGWAARKPGKLYAYGDSITQGVSVLSLFSGEYIASDDATQTYIQLLADALGVELCHLAYGSQALTFGSGSGMGNVPACYDGAATSQWRNRWLGISLLDTGGLLPPGIEYVTNNHLFNDVNMGASDTAISTAVAGWFGAVRPAAPSAWIIYVIPFTRAGAAAALTGFTTYAGTASSHTTVGATYYTASSDGRALLIDLGEQGKALTGSSIAGSPGTGDGAHLYARGQAAAASLLAAVIATATARENLPKFNIFGSGFIKGAMS